MKTAPLGTVADFFAGASLPDGETFKGQEGGYFMVRVSDMNIPGNEKHLAFSQTWSSVPGAKAATCPPGSLLIPKRGGAIGTNKKRLTLRPSLLDPNVMAIWPHPHQLDLNYLYQWFQTIDLSDLSSGSAVPQLNKRDLEPLSIPLPPLAEQERIAEALDCADALRVKRRQTIALLENLAQSVFQDMFGDPMGPTQRWPIANFADAVEEFRYGTSNKSTESGYNALRIPNVMGGTLDLAELKKVAVSDAELERLRLIEGDILFVRTNGNQDNVGRCAVFDPVAIERQGVSARDFIYASYLIRARLREETVLPVFVREFMLGNEGRHALSEQSKTSAGQFNINIQGIGAVPIPIPPLELQHEFAKRIAAIETEKARHRAHLAALDDLFLSVQSRAFAGTLFG